MGINELNVAWNKGLSSMQNSVRSGTRDELILYVWVLYVPVNNSSVMLGRFPVLNQRCVFFQKAQQKKRIIEETVA